MRRRTSFVVGLTGGLWLLGCSGGGGSNKGDAGDRDGSTASADAGGGDSATGGGGGGDSGTIQTPTSTTQPITAALGGTVRIGAATLTIPPDALTADTTITVTSGVPDDSLTNKADLFGLVYDFGPKGLGFRKSATLSLPLATAVPAGKKPEIAWLDTTMNKWIVTPSSSTGLAVVASVSHFTLFAVYLSAAATVDGGVPASGCNMITNVASNVMTMVSAGAIPTGTGGTIADGRYVLTDLTTYPGSKLLRTVYRQTIEITGSTGQMVIEDDGMAPVRKTFQIAPSGTAPNLTQTCSTQVPDVNIAYSSYTATPAKITFFSMVALFSTTYTKVN